MNRENDFQTLIKQLRQWDNRRRLVDALLWLPRGLLAGLLAAVVIAAVARFYPLLANDEVGYVAAGLALFGLLVMLVILLVRQRTVMLLVVRFCKYGPRTIWIGCGGTGGWFVGV